MLRNIVLLLPLLAVTVVSVGPRPCVEGRGCSPERSNAGLEGLLRKRGTIGSQTTGPCVPGHRKSLALRGQTVYFVHQSAKDFLPAKAAQEVFPAGREAVHQAIFARSLEIMSTTLRRDMYDLKALGTLIDDVQMPEPDPLAAVRYSCVHWVDHLRDSNPTASATYAEHLGDGGIVDGFLREKCLYWLECLSLCKSMSAGVLSMARLEALVQGRADAAALMRLVQDARRFLLYHKGVIENSPLQTYASALLFSPTGSLIRRLFQHEEPKWITIKPVMGDGWSACLQTLEGHNNDVWSVAFSHDSTRLASASDDDTVKIWDASSGACLQTLKGHSRSVRLVAFSPDLTRLASASDDNTVKIWDASSGACLQTLNVGKSLYSLSFNATGSCLLTEVGSMDVSTSMGTGTKNVTVLQRPQYLGVGISPDSTWITCSSNNLPSIPSEYRPSCSSVCGNTIGIGVGSGRLWICSINTHT